MKQRYRDHTIEVAVKPAVSSRVFTPRALVGRLHGIAGIQSAMTWPERPCATRAEAERRALFLARDWIDAQDRQRQARRPREHIRRR